MFRGIATLNFYAVDMVAAENWYSELFQTAPYFRRDLEGSPAYLEWRLGDKETEFGLIDARFAPSTPDAAGGAIAHWAVDDVEAAYAELLGRGATSYQSPIERGPGFITASVVDPFGNVLGVMKNEHYEEMFDVAD
ncbi:VOC family protein [Microbacterium murale]|uniref:Enzyme related to lactoylglutathione lyase n=1 Tax=Microbacterium murale TaxID=1081040 RepID=A0ABU0PCT4_9MICO|nr:VOC family protein [Microbacterium murale]MDQ0644802.1 putative enzyme related to lactoylglutathione lyase [Microbacterium murale]